MLHIQHSAISDPQCHVGLLLPDDLDAVLAIEAAAFDNPWAARDFHQVLDRPEGLGLVATIAGSRLIVGFAILESWPHVTRILDLAVSPIDRRRGVGRELLKLITAALDWADGPRRVVARVPERELAAQLFFRQCGFRVLTPIEPDYYDTGAAAYRFVMKKGQRGTGTEAQRR